MSSTTLPSSVEAARDLARSGRIADAEAAYAALLRADPAHLEALNFLATCARLRNNLPRATELLETALRAQPNDAETLKNLGVAYRAAGRLELARDTLEAALRAEPDYFVARLQLGALQEQLGDAAAVTTYIRAINQAQAQGLWLSDASTPPGLRDQVKQAMRVGWEGRRRVFGEATARLAERYGRSEMQRVAAGLAIYLGERPANLPDPRQQPLFFYLPGLPTTPYFERSLFPWIERAEAATDAVRAELLAMLAGEQGFEPFLKFHSPAEADAYLRGADGKPAWNAFFFYRHGEPYAQNAARCPNTSALLESLPLVRIREHAPEILYSVLTPGSHILPHRGVTNIRLVAHLPLVVPTDCALVVGGVPHVWQEGRVVVFDDTFEHEAWNRSPHTRVVLIMDAWNPHLSQAECAALTDLIGLIGDFNRAAGIGIPTG